MNIELYLVFVHYEGDRERIHHLYTKIYTKFTKQKLRACRK